MAESIPISEFELYLTDLVEKEVQNKLETVDEILHKRSMQLKGRISQLSPKDTGRYSRGWRVKTVQRNHEKVRLIYNAAKPGLTYLLEYGNRRQKARPHIRLALEETIDEIMEDLINQI